MTVIDSLFAELQRIRDALVHEDDPRARARLIGRMDAAHLRLRTEIALVRSRHVPAPSAPRGA